MQLRDRPYSKIVLSCLSQCRTAPRYGALYSMTHQSYASCQVFQDLGVTGVYCRDVVVEAEFYYSRDSARLSYSLRGMHQLAFRFPPLDLCIPLYIRLTPLAHMRLGWLYKCPPWVFLPNTNLLPTMIWKAYLCTLRILPSHLTSLDERGRQCRLRIESLARESTAQPSDIAGMLPPSLCTYSHL